MLINIIKSISIKILMLSSCKKVGENLTVKKKITLFITILILALTIVVYIYLSSNKEHDYKGLFVKEFFQEATL